MESRTRMGRCASIILLGFQESNGRDDHQSNHNNSESVRLRKTIPSLANFKCCPLLSAQEIFWTDVIGIDD